MAFPSNPVVPDAVDDASKDFLAAMAKLGDAYPSIERAAPYILHSLSVSGRMEYFDVSLLYKSTFSCVRIIFSGFSLRR